MRNLIERYVYDVTRRLPEAQREEVKKELTANINDMLGEKPTEQEIENVLLSLGHPRKLASNYREKQRYLIGPEWMDDYLMVLKIVLMIMVVVGLIGGLIGGLMNPESETVIGIIAGTFAKAISGVLEAAFRGFAIVTMIFIAVEFYNHNRNDEFRVRSLPEVPKEAKKELKRSKIITGIIFETIFGVLFIYLLATEQLSAVWFDASSHVLTTEPVFNQNIADIFIPIFIFSLGLTIIADLYRLIKNSWNAYTFSVYAIAKVFGTVVIVSFLTKDGVISTDFITRMDEVFYLTGFQMEGLLYSGLIGLAVLIVIGAVADLLVTWLKNAPNKE